MYKKLLLLFTLTLASSTSCMAITATKQQDAPDLCHQAPTLEQSSVYGKLAHSAVPAVISSVAAALPWLYLFWFDPPELEGLIALSAALVLPVLATILAIHFLFKEPAKTRTWSKVWRYGVLGIVNVILSLISFFLGICLSKLLFNNNDTYIALFASLVKFVLDIIILTPLTYHLFVKHPPSVVKEHQMSGDDQTSRK